MKNTPLAFLICLLTLLLFSKPSVGQNSYQKPTLTNQESWSLVLVPDPQSYVKFDRNVGILNLMTSWVRENVKPLNTKFVLCTGDLVEQNELLNPDGKVANQNSTQQWQSVSSAFHKLNNHVPYVLGTGNHDYGHVSAEYRSTQYDQYFSPEQNGYNASALREVGPALNGHSSSVNAVYEFETPHPKKI